MLRTGADLKRVSEVTNIGTRLPSDQSEVFIQQKGVKRLKIASDGALTLNDASGSIQTSITDKGVSMSQLQLQGKTTDPINPLPGTLIYDQQAEKIKLSRNNGSFEPLALADDNGFKYIKQNHIGHETPIDLKYTITFSAWRSTPSLRTLTFDRSGINPSSVLYTYENSLPPSDLVAHPGPHCVVVVFDPVYFDSTSWDENPDIPDTANHAGEIYWERNKVYRFRNNENVPVTNSFHSSPMFHTLNEVNTYETSLPSHDSFIVGPVYFLITSLTDHFQFQFYLTETDNRSDSVQIKYVPDIHGILEFGRHVEYPQYNFSDEKDLNLSFFITRNTDPEETIPRYDTTIKISDTKIYSSSAGVFGWSDTYSPSKQELTSPLKSSDGEDIFHLKYSQAFVVYQTAPYVTRSVMEDIQEQYTLNRTAWVFVRTAAENPPYFLELPGISVSPSTLNAFAETLLLAVRGINGSGTEPLDLTLSLDPNGLTVLTLDLEISSEFFELDLNPDVLYEGYFPLGPILGFTDPSPLTIDVSTDGGMVVDGMVRRYIFTSPAVGTWVRTIDFTPVKEFNVAEYDTYLTIEYKSSTQQARVGIQNALCGNEGPIPRILIDSYETLLDMYMTINIDGTRSALAVGEKTYLFMNARDYNFKKTHEWLNPLRGVGLNVQKTAIKYTPFFSLSAYTSSDSNLTIEDSRYPSTFTITDLTQRTKLQLPDPQRELYSSDCVVLDLSTLKGYVALPILTEVEKPRMKSSTGGLLGFFDGKLQYTALNGEWKEIAIV